jgi:hypothetical protein
MTVDIALASLKFLAILTAGLLGVIGLLVDFKVDGKITKWGRRALLGTVISTVVAVMTQSVETYKQNQERRTQDAARIQQEKRNEATLHEIRRGLYPIKEATFDVVIRLSKPADEVDRYLKRIKTFLAENRTYADKEDDDDYLLLEGKTVLPNRRTERVAFMALQQPNMVFRIFKNSTKADCFWKHDLTSAFVNNEKTTLPDGRLLPQFLGVGRDHECQADLELRSDPIDTGDPSIAVGVTKGAILLHFWNVHATVVRSRGGEVEAIPDLIGASMSLELRYGDDDDAWIMDTLRGARILQVSLLRIDAVVIPLSPIHAGRSGFIFDADFPSTEDQLWQRAGNDSPVGRGVR